MTKLSEEAQGWLEYFLSRPDKPINSATLIKLGVPHRKSKSIMGELLKKNVLKRVSHASGGSRLALADGDTVSPSGYSYIDYSAGTAIDPIAVQLEMRNIATNKFLDEVEGEGESVGYEFFESTSSADSDLIREREKHQAAKKAEYVAMREKAAQKRDVHRSQIDPANWTCKDIAYEFAARLNDMWDIPPFSVTQTRFVQALATFRKQHNTNGAIELELVNLFYESMRQDKYEDGNHVWRAFLFKAPSLLQTARERVVSAEVLETHVIRDVESANRKLALFEDDDDV